MRKNLFNTVALSFGALLLALVFAWNTSAYSAMSDGSEGSLLINGKGRIGGGLDDDPTIHRSVGMVNTSEQTAHSGGLILSKGKVRVDDAPKPDGPFHKRIENPLPSDESFSARWEGSLFAKGNRARGVIDAPIKNAPHAPGQVHG